MGEMLKLTTRNFASASSLKSVLKELVPKKQASLKAIVKDHGDKVIQNITVSSVVGGMRGLNCM